MANDSTSQVPNGSPAATPAPAPQMNAAADTTPQTDGVKDPPQKTDRVQDPNQQAGG